MHRADPVAPTPLSLFSRLSLPPGFNELNISARRLKKLVNERSDGIDSGVFDEAPSPITLDHYRHTIPPHPLNLHPSIPIFKVAADYDMESGEMEKFCRENPICIVRGLTKRLNINLSLYSIDALASLHPRMPLKMNVQTKNEKDTNLDEDGNVSWELVNVKGRGTLQSHQAYMQKMQDGEGKTAAKKVKKESEKIRFGVAHLSEHPNKFTQQIQELNKLPEIFRPGQPTDLLTLMGIYRPGLSGIYSFLKVEGVRTPCHEEDGGIPSVNVSIGPGKSEWMACHLSYVKKIEKECRKKGLVYGRSSVWPDLRDLEALGVPVYRFSQLPGDLVYTGPGTLHWVQGESVGCNIAWNSGSLSTQVLKFAKWEYERNRTNRRHSSIPMERTAWRVAAMGGITDKNVLFEVRGMLVRSLSHLLMTEKWLSESGVAVVEMAANEVDDLFDCDECESEIFNLVFSAGADIDHCFTCMMKKGGIQVHTPRRQRPMAVLSGIFDGFKM